MFSGKASPALAVTTAARVSRRRGPAVGDAAWLELLPHGLIGASFVVREAGFRKTRCAAALQESTRCRTDAAIVKTTMKGLRRSLGRLYPRDRAVVQSERIAWHVLKESSWRTADHGAGPPATARQRDHDCRFDCQAFACISERGVVVAVIEAAVAPSKRVK
jgi:hypothetical protein